MTDQNKIHTIVFAATIIFLVFLCRKVLSKIVLLPTKRIFSGNISKKIRVIDNTLKNHIATLIVFVAIFGVINVFRFPREIERILVLCSQLVFSIFGFVIAEDIISIIFEVFIPRKFIRDTATNGLLRFFRRLTNIISALIFLVIFLKARGYSVTGLLTTLGFGGAALALASRDSLANLFGSISLISDHVFRVGDNIKIGDETEGVVEDIGLRSTKIRTQTRSLVSVPNSVLANSKIDNLSRINGRFVNQSIYLNGNQASSEKITAFTSELTSYLQNDPDIAEDSVSIFFFDFTTNGIEVSLNYFTTIIKYTQYTKIRERVNQMVLNCIQAHELQFIIVYDE